MLETRSLEEYLAYEVVATCERCAVKFRRPVEEIIERFGDLATDELTPVLAAQGRCGRDPEADRQRCELHVAIILPERRTEPSIMVPQILRRFRANNASDDVMLGDFQEWDTLYAFCRCGHVRCLDKSALRAKYGPDMTLGDLKPRLRCRADRDHKDVGFAVGREKR